MFEDGSRVSWLPFFLISKLEIKMKLSIKQYEIGSLLLIGKSASQLLLLIYRNYRMKNRKTKKKKSEVSTSQGSAKRKNKNPYNGNHKG